MEPGYDKEEVYKHVGEEDVKSQEIILESTL
jgi:hypothetical protein